jgi:predicted DNA-binding protein YlxM (UPF0122 family)
MLQPAFADPMLVTDTVDNPYFGPTSPSEHKTIDAVRTLRDDPLGQMRERNQIGEAQYRAGRQWQADYEAAGPRIKSSGHLQEPVDGGGRLPVGITDRQIQARGRLETYRRLLGEYGTAILTMVLADKLSLREVANRRHVEVSKATLTYVGHRFREALSSLAVAMGLASANNP